MSSAVEQIKARLNILDVIGNYVKLEKAGVNYKGRCPFHNEKTPSFFVSPARQSYHCFGCSKGGDLISFVQEIEGLEFLEALEMLATQAGVELKPVNQGERTLRDRLLAIVEVTTQFYERSLLANPAVLTYLRQRGLTDETIKRFRIGFAPSGWRQLYDMLKTAGYSEEDMEKVGLIIKQSSSGAARGSGYYDRFRERIMFPLGNTAGKIVGFSGRIYGAADEQAKYINSPQTALYDKSEVLYGYDRAKIEIKRQDACVLVEGQIDLVLAHQAGTANTVAVSGTALTERHLTQISRLTNNLVMAFDSDLAGIAASRRALELALSLGLEVKIAELPPGKDPADVIVEKPELWHNAISQAKQVIDFYLSTLLKRGYDSRALKLAVRNEVLPYVARLNNAMDQAHFVGRIADALSVGEEPVWQELKKLKGIPGTTAGAKKLPLGAKAVSRRDIVERRLVSLWWWQNSVSESTLGTNIEATLQEILGVEGLEQLQTKFEPDREQLIMEAEIAYSGTEKLSPYFDELKQNLHELVLKEDLQSTLQELKQAEVAKDYDRIDKLLKHCQELSADINTIKSN
jgi:DNA primase